MVWFIEEISYRTANGSERDKKSLKNRISIPRCDRKFFSTHTNEMHIYRTTRIITLAFVLLLGPNLVAQLGSTPKPAPAPARWRGLIGEYGPDNDILIVLEKDGRLCAFFKRSQEFEILDEVDRDTFMFQVPSPHAEQRLTFARSPNGRATQAAVDAVINKRRNIEPETGNQLHIKPLRPVAELMKEALAAKPPAETGDFLPAALIELSKLDPTIHLE